MKKNTISLTCRIGLGLLLCMSSINVIQAESTIAPALSEEGRVLADKYQAFFSALKKDLSEKAPSIPKDQIEALLNARNVSKKAKTEVTKAEEEFGKGKKDTGKAAVLADAKKDLSKAVAAENAIANSILKRVDPFLSSDQSSDSLIVCSIFADATPKGLAEFAAKGMEQEAAVKHLLKDHELMKAMLAAGGAREGLYGRAAQIYLAIQAASPKAKEGVYQRLALAVSLAHAAPIRQRNPVAAANAPTHIDPIKRYLHFEKASLDGELDPAFPTLGTWELRHVVNGDESDETLAWGRSMLRDYRPDHVLNRDFGWRYSRVVHTDVLYLTDYAKNDVPALQFYQNIIKNGGVCGRRAFFGRFIIRAFGLPALPRPQRAHGALVRWTPSGWITNFGAGFGSRLSHGIMDLSDEDFLVESQLRTNPLQHKKALRAQSAGDALGEQKYQSLKPGTGGIWNLLSLYAKKTAVGKKTVVLDALGEELGESSGSEADRSRSLVNAKVTKADKKIIVAPNGAITIPAAATQGAQILGSFSGGQQLFSGGGSITFNVEVPKAGKYILSAQVVTVQESPMMQLVTNKAEPVEITVPYTIGKWSSLPAAEVNLTQGKNTFHFNRPKGSRGLSIKEFILTPMK